MRLSTDLQDSEVFNNFIKIAEKDNMMAKRAELIYPDYDISQSSHELDISLSVTAGEHDKLYMVHNERGSDLIEQAHPGGGTETQLDIKPSGNLALVETQIEQHKVFEEIACKLPTGKIAALSEHLVRLADKFDDAGFEVMAEYLTTTLISLNDIVKKKVVVAEDNYELGDIPASGGGSYQEHNFPTEEVRSNKTNSLNESIKAGNYKAQQLINQVRSARGLSPIKEDGIMGRESMGAMSELGVQPGSYRTWQELYSLLGKAGQAQGPIGYKDRSVDVGEKGPGVKPQASPRMEERLKNVREEYAKERGSPAADDEQQAADAPLDISMKGLVPSPKSLQDPGKSMVMPKTSPYMQQQMNEQRPKPKDLYKNDDGQLADAPLNIDVQNIVPSPGRPKMTEKTMIMPQVSKPMYEKMDKQRAKPRGLYNNDDGKVTEAARSRDFAMLEQYSSDEPELVADDPAILRQQALEQAKRRLQEAELNTALQGVHPRPVPSAGMPPRDVGAPPTDTFKLNKVRTTGAGNDPLLPRKDDVTVPQYKLDNNRVNLTPNQYDQMRSR